MKKCLFKHFPQSFFFFLAEAGLILAGLYVIHSPAIVYMVDFSQFKCLLHLSFWTMLTGHKTLSLLCHGPFPLPTLGSEQEVAVFLMDAISHLQPEAFLIRWCKTQLLEHMKGTQQA